MHTLCIHLRVQLFIGKPSAAQKMSWPRGTRSSQRWKRRLSRCGGSAGVVLSTSCCISFSLSGPLASALLGTHRQPLTSSKCPRRSVDRCSSFFPQQSSTLMVTVATSFATAPHVSHILGMHDRTCIFFYRCAAIWWLARQRPWKSCRCDRCARSRRHETHLCRQQSRIAGIIEGGCERKGAAPDHVG